MSALATLRRVADGVCASIERAWRGRIPAWAERTPRYELEPLERRQLLSVAASISGPAQVTEGAAYVLSLTATSTDPTFTVNNWVISYGDGTTHTLFGDSVADLYTYETPSSPTYQITATVFDTESGGATYSDSAGQAVTVDAASASLSLTPDPTAVFGEPFAITGNVVEGGNHTLSAYAIAWGDGGSSSDGSLPQDFTGSYADTLSHTYASTGTYDVTATAVTDQGTTTATTAIVAAPLFYSDYDPNGYTVGQAFDLTPTFTDPGHTLASYVVSWGDGSASSTYAAGTADFAHDYTADSASPYQATIIATADDGTWTDVESLSVAPPTLSVNAPASATQGATYTLTAGVTSGETLGSTYNFTIDWGDGAGAQDLSAPAGPLTYDYAEPGTYTISVEADGDGGQGDFAEAAVSVAVATPTVAVAHEDASATAGIAETFTDSYANPGGDPLDNLTVDWGDGNEDAYYLDRHSEAHAYAHPGSYDVTDTFVTDHDTYTASTAIDVVDAGSLSFSDAGGTIEGSVFFVYATLNEPDGQTPSNYHVAWGDGQQDDWGPASQGTFTHVYNTLNGSPGYFISVTATTPDGTYISAATQGAEITTVAAVMDLTSPNIVEGGAPFLVSAFWLENGHELTTYPVADHPVTYSIDWGDGQTGTSVGDDTFTHAYVYNTDPQSTFPPNFPEYTVTAYTDEGTIGQRTGGCTVEDPAGSGQLSVDPPSSTVEGDTVTLTANFADANQGPDDSQRVAGSWIVFWGDGTSDQNGGTAAYLPTHTYNDAGEFTLTVVAGYSEESPPNWDVNGVYETHTLVPVDVGVDTPTVTATGDTTATVTGDTYTLSVGYTNTFTGDGSNHQPQRWHIAWGDGVSDDYYTDFYGNLPAQPTHVYATASTGGTNYSPQATVYTDEGSFTPTAAPNLIVAQPMMQYIEGDGTTMDHNAQHTMGAFVSDDPNDQQTSLTSADPEVAEMQILPLPSRVGGTYTLSIPTDVTAWADPEKDNPISTGQIYDATSAHTFYVAGAGISPQMATDRVSVSWAGGLAGALSVAMADFIAVTGVAPRVASTVPDYSLYAYAIKGAIPAGMGGNAWSATGGAITPSGPDQASVFWNNPLNGAGNGWEGTVSKTIQVGNNQVKPVIQKVEVVYVNLEWSDFNPLPGDPVDAGVTDPAKSNNILRKLIASGGPGASATVELSLSSPPQAPKAWKRIVVGFVQHLTSYSNEGTYTLANGKVVTLKSIYETPNGLFPALDYDPSVVAFTSQRPWYVINPAAFFNGQEATSPNATLDWDDTPKNGPPIGVNHQAKRGANEPPLNHMALSESFQLDICAATFDDPSGSKPFDGNNQAVYTRLATSDWKFNVSADIVNNPATNYPWANQLASVVVPEEWTAVTDGSRPSLAGSAANALSAKERFR